MSGPLDTLVRYGGEPVLLVACTAAAFDSSDDEVDDFDPATATFTATATYAIIEGLAERGVSLFQGRGIDATAVATLLSSVTARSDREGRADRIVRFPDATTVTAATVGGVTTVTIDGTGYVASFDGATTFGAYAGEIREYEVLERDRAISPFGGTVHNSVALRELSGRR